MIVKGLINRIFFWHLIREISRCAIWLFCGSLLTLMIIEQLYRLNLNTIILNSICFLFEMSFGVVFCISLYRERFLESKLRSIDK